MNNLDALQKFDDGDRIAIRMSDGSLFEGVYRGTAMRWGVSFFKLELPDNRTPYFSAQQVAMMTLVDGE